MMRRIRDTTRALPRRALMRGVTAGSIAAYLGGAASGPANAAEEATFPAHPRWKFVFVNHVTSNPFLSRVSTAFPAAQILKADVNMASPRRLRWSGACSKVVEASTSAVGTPRADLGAMSVGSDDPWRFI